MCSAWRFFLLVYFDLLPRAICFLLAHSSAHTRLLAFSCVNRQIRAPMGHPSNLTEMNVFWDQLNSWLGLQLEPKNLTFLQISLRGVVVFIASLIIIRLGSKRALAQKTAFDAVLLVVLASVLAR